MKILFSVSYYEDELKFDVKNKRSMIPYSFKYITCRKDEKELNWYLQNELNIDWNQYTMKVLTYIVKDNVEYRTPIKVYPAVHGLDIVTKYFALDSDIDMLVFNNKIGDTVFGFLN